MLKEAINRILELAGPHIREVEGSLYCDKDMERLDVDIRAAALQMGTLSSLVDFIKGSRDFASISYRWCRPRR